MDNELASKMAINQIDFISKMYDMKDELYKQILDLQVEVKQLKRKVEKLQRLKDLEEQICGK